MPFRLANVAGRAALLVGDLLYDVEQASGGALGPDVMAALAHPEELSRLATTVQAAHIVGPRGDVVLGPPVPRPSKTFGIGLNYRSHAEEAGLELPDVPLVFTKFPSCLVGPTADVVLRSNRCDYEGELVVVIGAGGRDIAVEDAERHVLGLMVGQDISDRRVQFSSQPPHFSLGKSFDTFGPIGPVLVSADALSDPLRIRTWVNGELRQDDTTASFVFDVPTLVSYLSRVTTLQTGDLIFTGTPAGVGGVRRAYLADGDVITTTIDGVGTLTNRCVQGAPYPRFTPPRRT